MISIVNENDKEIAVKSRKEAHEKSLLHRESGLFIINEKGEHLVQVRANNKKYDYCVAGHFSPNENYKDGIIREAKEEIDLDINKNQLKSIAKIRQTIINSKGKIVNKFMGIFEIVGSFKLEQFKINKNEIERLEFFSIEKIKNMIARDKS